MSSAAEKFKAQRLSQLSRNSTFLITNGLNNSGVMADEDEENLIGKVKKKSDKRLYDEDIIDGFSFLSFESYQDIEETFKPFLKARIENQNHAAEVKKKMPKPRSQNRVPKSSKKRGESGPTSPRERQLNFDGSSDVSQPGSSFGEQMVDASESEDTCDNTIEFAAPQIEKTEPQTLRNSFDVGPSSLPAVLSPVAPVPSQEKPPSPLPGTTVTAEQFAEVISPHQEPSQTPSSSVPPTPPAPEVSSQRQPTLPVENAAPTPVVQPPPIEPPLAHSSHVDHKYPPYTHGYLAPQMPSSGFSQLHRFSTPGGNQAYQPPSFAVPGEKGAVKQAYPPATAQNYYADPALSRPDPTLSRPEASQQMSAPLSLTVRQETDAHNYTIQNLVKRERSTSGPKPEPEPQKFSTHKTDFYNRTCEPFRPFENHRPSEHQKPPVSVAYSTQRNSEPVKSEFVAGVQKPVEASHSFSNYRPYELHKSESHKPSLYKPEYAPENYQNRDLSSRPVHGHDASNQRLDSNRSYRPDSGSSYRPESNQGPNYRPGSNQGPSYKLESNLGSSYKPEAVQGQIYSNQGLHYRPESNQGPSYRSENHQGPNYRPESNQGLSYKPESNQAPNYRPESQGPNFRPEGNQGLPYRPESNQVPNYRPDSGHVQGLTQRVDGVQKTAGVSFSSDNIYKQETMFKQENAHQRQTQRQELDPRSTGDLRYNSGYRLDNEPNFGANQRSESVGRLEVQQSMQSRSSADKAWTEPQNLSIGSGRSVASLSSSSQPSGPSEPPWKQDYGMSSELMKLPGNTPAQVPYPPKPSNHTPVSSASSSVAAAHPFSMSKLVGSYPSMSQPEDLSRIPNGYPPATQSYSYPGFPQYSSHSTHSPQSAPIPKSVDSSSGGHNFFRPIASPKANPYPTPPISGQPSFAGETGRSDFPAADVPRREEVRLKPPSPSPRSKQQMMTSMRSSSSSSPQISTLPRPAVLESPSFKSVSKPSALQPSPSVPFSPNYPAGMGSLHGGTSTAKKDYGDIRQPTLDSSVPCSLPGSALYSSGHSHFPKVEGPDSLARITPGANFGRIEPIPPYQPFFPAGGEMSSFNSVSQTGAAQFPAPPAVKKSGRWNSMHVKLAWEIFHHQQRSRTVGDPKRTPFVIHSSAPNPGSILTAKAQQPSGSSLFPGLTSKPLVEPPSQSFMPPPPQAAASFGIPSSMASPYNPYSLQSMANGPVTTQPQVTKATPTQSPSIDPWSRQHRTPPVSAGSGPQTPNWPPRSDSANSSNREKDRERHRRDEHRKAAHPLGHVPGHLNSERRRSHSRSPLHVDESRLRNDVSEPGASRSDNFDLKSGRTSIDRMKPSDISTSKAASSVSSGYDSRTSVPSLPTLPTLSSVPSLQMSAPSLYPRDLGIGLDRNLLQGLSGSYPSVPSDPRLTALGLDPLQQAYLADREREAIMKLNASRYGLGLPPGLGYGMERFASPALDMRELERAKLAAAFGLGGSSLFSPQAGSSYSGLGLPSATASSIPVSAYQGYSPYPKPPSATSFGYGPSGSAVPSILPSVSRSSGLPLGLGSSMGLGPSSLNGLYPSGANTFLPPSLRAPVLPQSLGLSGYPGLSSMGVRHPGLGFPGLDASLNPLGPRPPF